MTVFPKSSPNHSQIIPNRKENKRPKIPVVKHYRSALYKIVAKNLLKDFSPFYICGAFKPQAIPGLREAAKEGVDRNYTGRPNYQLLIIWTFLMTC